MKLKFLNIVLGVLLSGVFVGCIDNIKSDSGSGLTLSLIPTVDYDCESLSPTGDKVLRTGVDGSIDYDCVQNLYSYGGIYYLTPQNIQIDSEFTYIYSDGRIVTFTVSADALSGIESFKGTSSTNGVIDCQTSYNITLNIPINESEISDMVNPFTSDKESVSTCPSWLDGDDTLIESISLENITVTDSLDKEHKISIYNKFN